VIASLKRELAQTKKELDYYKKKEKPEELQPEEIP
jgi:hypothetical protein